MELIKDKVMQTHNGVLLLDGYPRNMSNYRVGKTSVPFHRRGVRSWETAAMCWAACCTSAATSSWRSA